MFEARPRKSTDFELFSKKCDREDFRRRFDVSLSNRFSFSLGFLRLNAAFFFRRYIYIFLKFKTGMSELVKERPAKPIEFLASYLLQHDPQRQGAAGQPGR